MCMPTTVDMSQIPSEAEAGEKSLLKERIRLLEIENKQATIRIQYYLREIERFETENIMLRLDKVNGESERRTKIKQED